MLEWLAYPFSRGSFQPRNQTRVSCIAGGFFTRWATREDPLIEQDTLLVVLHGIYSLSTWQLIMIHIGTWVGGSKAVGEEETWSFLSVSYSCEHHQSVSPPWGQFFLEVAVESSWHFFPILEEPVLSNPTPAWDSSSSQAIPLPALLWAQKHQNLLSSSPSSEVWVLVLQGVSSRTLDFSNPSLCPLCPPP